MSILKTKGVICSTVELSCADAQKGTVKYYGVDSDAVLSPRGYFGGLIPPKQSSKPLQLKYETL